MAAVVSSLPAGAAALVVGLGIDIVELDRVERALARWGSRLVARLMDPPEAAALPASGPERARAVAIAVALKEAGSKSIGTGWTRGVRWRDVVVSSRPRPAVRFAARAALFAAACGSRGDSVARVELRGPLVIGEVRLLS